MPCEDHTYQTAKTMLDKSPLKFSIEQYNWDCKLSYKEKPYPAKYLLWINEVLVSDLPAAPPIKKDNIPVVC